MAKIGGCIICSHPKAAEIDKALAMPGARATSVARLFDVHPATLTNHLKTHIPKFLEAAEAAVRVERGLDIKEVVFRNADVLSKSIRACDKWLTDPDNPDEYTFDPRSHELLVVYLDKNDCDEKGNPKRKKTNLQRLLDMATIPDRPFDWASDQTVDVWAHSLKTIREWNDLIDRWAKLNGLYQKERANEADEEAKRAAEIKWLRSQNYDDEAIERIRAAASGLTTSGFTM
jgi:head-tail adaptor